MPTMKGDLRAQLVLLNKNVDEMIRLVQRAHLARPELVRAKSNADFSELAVLRERANESRPSAQNAHPLTEK